MITKFFQYFLYENFVCYLLQKPKSFFLSLSNETQHWITLNHKHNIPPPKENIKLTLDFCCYLHLFASQPTKHNIICRETMKTPIIHMQQQILVPLLSSPNSFEIPLSKSIGLSQNHKTFPYCSFSPSSSFDTIGNIIVVGPSKITHKGWSNV